MNRREFLYTGLAALPAAAAITRTFDPAFGTARDAAEAIRKKKISSVELTQEIFRRIDKYNPKLNAIIIQFREQALAQAKAADAQKQSTALFHGVPITVKESYHIAGVPTTWGIPQAKDFRPKTTAIAVQRMQAAGAVDLGKTNVPLMLSDQQSYNEIYGQTNNPWDLGRTPGGSTGGGAAALAAGLGFVALGSDIGGSIRVPAHFCGVYGLKPTLELVSQVGQTPPGIELNYPHFDDLAVCGPLARSAADLHDALAVLAGPSGFDAKAYRWSAPAPRQKRLADFRVGYVLDDPACPVSSELAPVYEATLRALEKSGAKLTKGWPAGVDPKREFANYLFLLGSALGESLPEADKASLKMIPKDNPMFPLAEGAFASAGQWRGQTNVRLAMRAVWQKYFENVDVFLSPTSFLPAYPHDHSMPVAFRMLPTPEGKRMFNDSLFWIHPATLTGCPAVSAPVGLTAGGLPVGLQIMGPYLEDPTAIEFAAALAGVVGGFQPPKGYIS